jgi:hypothetical protein
MPSGAAPPRRYAEHEQGHGYVHENGHVHGQVYEPEPESEPEIARTPRVPPDAGVRKGRFSGPGPFVTWFLPRPCS